MNLLRVVTKSGIALYATAIPAPVDACVLAGAVVLVAEYLACALLAALELVVMHASVSPLPMIGVPSSNNLGSLFL